MNRERDDAVSSMLDSGDPATPDPVAARVIAGMTARSWSLATAESLTGGLVCARLTAIPGASAVVIGSIVSYAEAVKSEVLNVDRALLEAGGAVQAEVAEQMARGAALALKADCTVATTGSAGPDSAPGGRHGDPVSPGLVYVAVHSPEASWVEEFRFRGDRAHIRAQSVQAALHMLEIALRQVE